MVNASRDDLEARLNKLLPSEDSQGQIELDSITNLTRQLIAAGGGTSGYTHSVCHLFEKYPYDSSYLNSDSLLPVAEELTNSTLRKAYQNNEFGCVDRIIEPIISLNVRQLESNPNSFTFKPAILSDEDFMNRYFLEMNKGEYSKTHAKKALAFSKAKNMKEFFEEYVKIKIEEEGLDSRVNLDETVPGVFIDVDHTLMRNEYQANKSVYVLFPLTQEYALKQLENGVQVTVFTSGDPAHASAKLRELGVDSRLTNVQSKKGYIGKRLERCVDDTTPTIQGFKANTHYSSGEIALKAEYPEHLNKYLEQQKIITEENAREEQKRIAEEKAIAEQNRLAAEKALREKGFIGFFRKMFSGD